MAGNKRGFVVIPAMRNPRTGRITKRNIAAGFYDSDGKFHPIRASFDYDPGRTGEMRSLGKGLRVPRKKKKKTARRR